MSASSQFLNRFCKMLYRHEYRKFSRPCSIRTVQRDYLMRLLRNNADTVYGKKYHFADIRHYEEFSEKVPLTVYEDYEPYIEQAAAGSKRILTAEDILLFELTSGSSGGKKLIPYTRSLKAEFQRGIRPWLYDIYDKADGVCRGKSYWSITPVTEGKSYTDSGIPIGFEEDAQYFGVVEQKIMEQLFAVRSDVKFTSSQEEFYFQTAVQLLNCRELSLISVWSPTFLSILCDFIRAHMGELAGYLPNGHREQVREDVYQNRFDRVFPHLSLISCWMDGSAADYAEALKKRFPGVYFQPKGLLATECFVSLPLVGEEGSRLSMYSHFFEFRSLSDGRIYTAEQLEKGVYEVIVTTGGGFYRYGIGDRIEVLETYEGHPPRIRFLGRGRVCSDRFGEKLTEEFVRRVCTELGIQEQFCLLAPEGARYCLYTTDGNIRAERLEEALCESYHYNYCRKLGQLEPAVIRPVCGNPQEDYMRRLTNEGMRLGDIKPAYLSNRSGWERWFHKK